MERKLPKEAIPRENLLPEVIHGVPTEVIESGRFYLSLEFIEGENLEDRLARMATPGLPEQQVLEWAAVFQQTQRWIAAGKLKPIEPKVLFYMIWATTQQYANAAHEMATLNGGRPLDDAAFDRAKRQVIETIVGGVTT